MQFIKRFAVATAVATTLTAGTSVASVEPTQPILKDLIQSEQINSNRLLVKFRETTSETTMLQVLQPFSLDEIKAFYKAPKLRNLAIPGIDSMGQWRILSFDSSADISETFQNLKANPYVESVVPDTVVYASATPNDLDSQLWGLHNTGQDNGTADVDIDAVEAWDTITDASDVIVAVIDTGVDYTHPDLATNIWTNPGEIAGNGIDDDGNGYIDDIHGYDFVNNDNDPMDDHSHGTHVAGTIAAEGNNGQGIVGIAWQAQIMALKFLSGEGVGYTSDAINAILYAADNGAVISNNSWSSVGATYVLEQYQAPLKDAIEITNQAGHLFVAAAGNDYANNDEGHSNYPAGIPLTNIISVAATDRNDELADFSNYGEVEVDIAAPGVAIYSTIPGGLYDSFNGTSMATPHVAGAAALLYATKPDITPQEAKAILMNTADPVASLAGKVGNSGRLNLANALNALSEGGSCSAHTATPQNHINAGRAHNCGFFNLYACANGSNTQIGLASSSTSVELVESSPGYFEVGQCAAGLDLPPFISMNGDAEARVLLGDSYTAPGAVASDREDGALSVTSSGSVDTSTAGSYVITYNATDSAGNSATTERRLVHVLELDRPPSVYLFGPHCNLVYGSCTTLFIEQNTAFVEPGYIAIDETDGDLSNNVQTIGSVVTDTSTIGRYIVKYDVTDSSGQHNTNIDFWFRDVFVLDAEIPYIFLNTGETEFSHARGVDGSSISHRIYTFAADLKDEFQNTVTEGEVDVDTVGTYNLHHHYTDTDGNLGEAYQTVHIVEDTTPPSITLNGDPMMTIQQGGYFNDPFVTVTDDLDLEPGFATEGYVDRNTVGTYQIRYWSTDDSGNESESVYRTVIVESPCTEFSDSNQNHVDDGRAYACGFLNLNACALGSGDDLGSRSLGTSTVHTLTAGHYNEGSCPN